MSVSPDASSSLADDHPARIVWSCVEQQIYSDPQSARALALWLYASLQQVGSVSALALLCESDAAYAWLAGDAPFDAARLHAFRLDEGNAPLLQHNLAALLLSGVGPVSQTAPASGSEQDRFRHFLIVAEQQLQKLKRHLDDAADVFLSERALARDRARVEYENKVKASLSVLSQLFEWSKQEAARKLQAELEAKKQAEAKARAAAKEKAQREAEEAARLATAKRKARPSRGPVVRYAPVSPWALDMAGVKRLRMTLTWAGAVFLLFSVTTMSVKPKPIDRAEAEKVSPRLAQLVMEKKVELAKRPPPVPVPPKEELKENLKDDASPSNSSEISSSLLIMSFKPFASKYFFKPLEYSS